MSMVGVMLLTMWLTKDRWQGTMPSDGGTYHVASDSPPNRRMRRALL